ncbi:MAG: translation initiation factor IF-3 [Candidatus Atribacteria bacterium]|nr:translation initiation factor IF-3 [Candidatus Atribacteria bacterium]
MNTKDVVANENIRLKEVRLVDENGAQMGIMSSRDALNIAREKGLDLVLIAPNANPPVCKIVDLGKYLYEQTKREKEAKKKQTKIEVKEMRYRLKIDTNDLAVKNKKVREFIENGNRVSIEIWFRGREMAFVDKGYELADKIINALSDVAVVASPPKMNGRNLVFSLEPNKDVLKKLRERREKNEKQNQVEQISNEEV